jgi:steroid 5-alpha reductase family enzyme
VLNSLFSENLFQTELFAFVVFTSSYAQAAILVITLYLIQDIGVLKAGSGMLVKKMKKKKPEYRNYYNHIAIYRIGHFVSQYTGKPVYRYTLRIFKK